MNNSLRDIIIGGALAIIISIVLFGITGASTEQKNTVDEIPTPIEQSTDTTLNEETQEVTLTFENYKYHLEPATLIKDVPVRMTVDLDSVYGCMRDIIIPSQNLRKYVREGDNSITFVPTKTGEFSIHCSMNMGRGSFKVIEQ